MRVSLGLDGVAVKNLPCQSAVIQKKQSSVQTDAINLNNSPNNVSFGRINWIKKEITDSAQSYENWIISKVLVGADSKSDKDISRYIDNDKNFTDLIKGYNQSKTGGPALYPESAYYALKLVKENHGSVGESIYKKMSEKIKGFDFYGSSHPADFDYNTHDGFPINELLALIGHNNGGKTFNFSSSFVRHFDAGSYSGEYPKGDHRGSGSAFDLYNRGLDN